MLSSGRILSSNHGQTTLANERRAEPMIIRNIIWIAGQAVSGLHHNWPVSVVLVALLIVAAFADVRTGRFSRGSMLMTLSLPPISVVLIIITGGIFERMPTLVFLPYAEMVLCLALSVYSVWHCRVMWRTAIALSLCSLWLGFWGGLVAIMSVSGDWL